MTENLQPRHDDGKWSAWVRDAAPDNVIVDTSALSIDHTDVLRRGSEVELTGPAAAIVVPGASRVALQYADPDVYAEAEFTGFDLHSRIDHLLSGGENHAYTTEEYLDERGADIDRWFRDRNIVRSGEWGNATLTQIIELGDAAATFAVAQTAFTADADTDELRAAAAGERDNILQELDDHMAIESCQRCWGDLSDNEGYDGLCGTCADGEDDDEEDEED